MPRTNFTARGIAAIKPPAKGRIEYWDEGMPGFGLRVSATGVRTWVTMYRHKGRLCRHTLGTYPVMTLADAHELARGSLNAAAKGEDPATRKRAERLADTFGDLAQEFLERHSKQRKKSWKLDEYILRKDLLPRWKNHKANEITRRDVIHLVDGVVARGAPIHANRVFSLIRKVFNFGIGRSVVEHNPCAAVPLPAKPQSRDRVLSADEIRWVWQALPILEPPTAAVFKLMFLLAQRGGEVRSMAWRDLDLAAGWWTIPAECAKNGLSHRVPLGPWAVEIIRERLSARKNEATWVFPSPTVQGKHVENIQKAVQRLRSRAGILKAFEEAGIEVTPANLAGLRFASAPLLDFVAHDARRTAASHMASIGIPRFVISKILNHISGNQGVTAVYDRHSYDREKREALELWEAQLQAILDKRDEQKVLMLKQRDADDRKGVALNG